MNDCDFSVMFTTIVLEGSLIHELKFNVMSDYKLNLLSNYITKVKSTRICYIKSSKIYHFLELQSGFFLLRLTVRFK